MSFSLLVFLIIYFVYLIIFFLFSGFALYHLFRFGFQGKMIWVITTIFFGLVILTLIISGILLFDADWSGRVFLFSDSFIPFSTFGP